MHDPYTVILPPGPALDKLACEALTRAGCTGWEPRLTDWNAVRKSDGAVVHVCPVCMSPDRQREFLQTYADHDDTLEVRRSEIYPRISTDWSVAGRALEAMRELGWLGKPRVLRSGYCCTFIPITGKRPMCAVHQEAGDTGPHAIALALVAALEAPCE